MKNESFGTSHLRSFFFLEINFTSIDVCSSRLVPLIRFWSFYVLAVIKRRWSQWYAWSLAKKSQKSALCLLFRREMGVEWWWGGGINGQLLGCETFAAYALTAGRATEWGILIRCPMGFSTNLQEIICIVVTSVIRRLHLLYSASMELPLLRTEARLHACYI